MNNNQWQANVRSPTSGPLPITREEDTEPQYGQLQTSTSYRFQAQTNGQASLASMLDAPSSPQRDPVSARNPVSAPFVVGTPARGAGGVRNRGPSAASNRPRHGPSNSLPSSLAQFNTASPPHPPSGQLDGGRNGLLFQLKTVGKGGSGAGAGPLADGSPAVGASPTSTPTVSGGGGLGAAAGRQGVLLQPQLQISGKRNLHNHNVSSMSGDMLPSSHGAGYSDFSAGSRFAGMHKTGSPALPPINDPQAAAGARLRGEVTKAQEFTAVPRMVQDTAKCIPLLKLLGRFSARPRAKPVSKLGKSLKDAVHKMQAPIRKGYCKIKVAGQGLLHTFVSPRKSEDEVEDRTTPPDILTASPLRKKQPSPEPATPTPMPGIGVVLDKASGSSRSISPMDIQHPELANDLRVVYIQIKHAHGLVKPQVQGVHTEYATYVVIRAGDIQFKTQVQKGSAAPSWNEVFEFTVAQLGGSWLLQLEVWDVDAWGRDFFIGQAEIELEHLLLSAQPLPMDANLPLVLLDPHTGQLEPGIYGHLAAVVWLGGDPTGPAVTDPTACAVPAMGMEAQVTEDGFQVSSLLVRDGLPKGLPMVTHSPLGTLYEEPCIVFVKLSVMALRDINLQRLLQAALISNRTIRLMPRSSKHLKASGLGIEPASSSKVTVWQSFKNSNWMSRTRSGAISKQDSSNSPARQLRASESSSDPGTASQQRTSNSDSVKKLRSRGKRAVVRADSQQQQGGRSSDGAEAGRRGLTGAGEGRDVMKEDARGSPHAAQKPAPRQALNMTGMTLGLLVLPARATWYAGKLAYKGTRWAITRGQRDRGAVPLQGPARQVQVPDGSKQYRAEGVLRTRIRRRSVGPVDGVEDADEEELMMMMEEAADVEGDGDEGSEAGGQGADNTTISDSGELQGSVLGSSTDGGLGPCDGPGTYYYFKATLGSQTYLSRMRWLPLNNPNEIRLANSHFGFTVQRPIPDLNLTLSLYVTPTNKRKGRVAAKLSAPLSALMDMYAPGAVMSRDGAPDGVILPFEDEDFGSAQLLVQLADADWRGALYKVPQMATGMVDAIASPDRGLSRIPYDAFHHITRDDMLLMSGQQAAAGGVTSAVKSHNPVNASEDAATAYMRMITVGGTKTAASMQLNGNGVLSLSDSLPTSRGKPMMLSLQQQQQRQAAEASLQGFVASDPMVAAVLQARSTLTQLRNRMLQMCLLRQSQYNPNYSSARCGGGAVTAAGQTPQMPSQSPSRSQLRSMATLALQCMQRKAMALLGMQEHPDRPMATSPLGGLIQRQDALVARAKTNGGGGAFMPGTSLTAPIGPSNVVKPPLGEVRLRITTLRPRSSQGSISNTSPAYALIKCGPHWVRTVERWSTTPSNIPGAAMTGVGSPQVGGATTTAGYAASFNQALNWEVRLPLYDPSTLLSIAVVELNTSVATLVGKSPEHTVVGKARMRLSTLDPFSATPGWHTLTVLAMQPSSSSNSSSSQQQGEAGNCGSGSHQQAAAAATAAAQQGGTGVASAGGAAGAGGGFPDRRLRHSNAGHLDNTAATAASVAVDQQADVLCVVQVQVRYPSINVSHWKGMLKLFGMYMESQLPEPFYYLEVNDGDTWKLMQAEANNAVRRWLSAAAPALPANVCNAMVADGRSQFSLARAQDNFTRAKAALHMFGDLSAWFKHIKSWESPRASCEVAFCIFLLCYYPSIAFKLFFYLLALASWRQYCRIHGGCAAMEQCRRIRQQEQEQEQEGADIPTNATALQALRQRYLRVLDIALSAQNLFDDVATFFERLQAIMSWRDRAASLAFSVACVAAMLAIQLLGLSFVLCALLLWLMRPPRLQDPIPPVILNYFLRLPCQNDDNM